jgi:hypothetical protein
VALEANGGKKLEAVVGEEILEAISVTMAKPVIVTPIGASLSPSCRLLLVIDSKFLGLLRSSISKEEADVLEGCENGSRT